MILSKFLYISFQMESLLRLCQVMDPKDYYYAKEGDDIFLCEYEYDVCWHSFKRLAEIDKEIDKEEVSLHKVQLTLGCWFYFNIIRMF